VDRPTLWHLPLSPYSEKVRWALDYKGVPHARRAAVPGLHIPVALALTRGGSRTLPVMAFDGGHIADSTAIVAALEERHPDPPLYPADPAERRRALELEDWFDEQLGPSVRRFSLHAMRADREQFDELASRQLPKPLRRYRGLAGAYGRAYTGARFQTVSDTRADAARGNILAAFDHLESELGGGEYLVGRRVTVADLTAAAMFSLVVLPPEGPIDIDPPAPIVELRKSLAGRRGYEWVLETFARHRRAAAPIRRAAAPNRRADGPDRHPKAPA
jgi:glutathione S-transferase